MPCNTVARNAGVEGAVVSGEHQTHLHTSISHLPRHTSTCTPPTAHLNGSSRPPSSWVSSAPEPTYFKPQPKPNPSQVFFGTKPRASICTAPHPHTPPLSTVFQRCITPARLGGAPCIKCATSTFAPQHSFRHSEPPIHPLRHLPHSGISLPPASLPPSVSPPA